MKKINSLIILLLLCCLCFASCGDEEGSPEGSDSDETHSHSFGEWVITKAPTCQAKGQREQKCSCGETVTEAIAVLEHVFDENGTCTCGVSDGISHGLEYKLSSENDYYIVTGIGTCKDHDIVIPGTHNGLPVKVIDGLEIAGADSIVISEGIEIVETLL